MEAEDLKELLQTQNNAILTEFRNGFKSIKEDILEIKQKQATQNGNVARNVERIHKLEIKQAACPVHSLEKRVGFVETNMVLVENKINTNQYEIKEDIGEIKEKQQHPLTIVVTRVAAIFGLVMVLFKLITEIIPKS